MQSGRHICSGASANTVKCLYTNVPGHILIAVNSCETYILTVSSGEPELMGIYGIYGAY